MRASLLKLAAWLAAHLPPGLRVRMYRLGPLSGLIRRALNQAAPRGLTRVTIAAGLLAGATFQLDLQSEKDLWLGTYEADLLDRLPRWIKRGMVVFDVGANLGYLSVGFARLVGPNGRVHAFEPLPMNIERLRSSVASNEMNGRVEIVPQAVGAEQGVASFLVHPSGGMGKLEGSHGRRVEYEGRIDAVVMTLDSYSTRHGVRPDWVKVDVEGGEGAVLRGSEFLLGTIRPNWLMEIHGPEAASEVWQLMRSSDYMLFSVSRPDRVLRSLGELDWKAYLLARPREKIKGENHA